MWAEERRERRLGRESVCSGEAGSSAEVEEVGVVVVLEDVGCEEEG